MSDWYWRVIALKAAFVLTCLVSYLNADDTIQKLPFCNPHTADDASATDDLVIVSTLDGRLTAFVASNGIKAWDVQTQPLLSSNLHHVELTSGGKWVRLVPSLRGTLYSLSGDTVEPLPFDADQLLSSSFKYSEDLVIAGARETLWLGLDARTGAVVYECGGSGCSGDQASGRALLVLRRHSSTVRALDPRNGNEKWNFSVGEHQLALSARGCGDSPGPAPPDYSVGLALPEGVLAVRQPGSQLVLWKQTLGAPAAGLWRLRGGALHSLDVLWAATRALSSDSIVQAVPPSLYIGLHDTQLYIQEGPLYIQKMDTAVSAKPLPWKLKHVRPLITGPDSDLATSLQESDPNTLSLITLYGNTRDENRGYFLYQEETCDQAVQVTEDAFDAPATLPPDGHPDPPDHHHIHVHVYSLWFWWKEVLVIAISSALLMNLMIWPRFFASKPALLPVTPVPQYANVYRLRYEQPPVVAQPEYSGRYENDFTPLRCLGRGGFGVVFEARNNIDHCSYAVKRITLPRRESKRERVLREVRALAKLEHKHIVRYFNAWLEEPPADWQQRRDAHWMRELDGVSVTMTEEATSPRSSQVSPPPPASPPPPGHLPPGHPAPGHPAPGHPAPGPAPLLRPDPLDFEKELGPKRLRSLSCSDSLSIVFDSRASDADTKGSAKHSLDLTSDRSLPPGAALAKNPNSGDDDSFIVFEGSNDVNHNSQGLSEARNDSSYVKLSRVDEDATKTVSVQKKKKKGHTRHWSLDMCVKGGSTNSQSPPSKMYLYIQMQLCRRDSLHDWLRCNRTFESRGDKIKTLFSQILSAVEYVHLAGLIHRDLKPSNIFFAFDGKVVVGDFGLVTAMGDSSQDGEEPPQELEVHSRHTYRVGTHLYMSPEQLRGGRYGYKVDIYSLGLVLLELLQPFGTEAERVGCLLAARRGQMPPGFRRRYPEELEMLRRMLSEDPAKRPSASDVRAGAPLHERLLFCDI